MTEWQTNPRNYPPPEGVLVTVRGCDCLGYWYGEAMRKDYKPGSSKAQLRRRWRWVAKDGTRFDWQVDAWRYGNGTEAEIEEALG